MINNKNYQQNDQQKNPINIKNQHLLTTTNINKDYQQEINKKKTIIATTTFKKYIVAKEKYINLTERQIQTLLENNSTTTVNRFLFL